MEMVSLSEVVEAVKVVINLSICLGTVFGMLIGFYVRPFARLLADLFLRLWGVKARGVVRVLEFELL